MPWIFKKIFNNGPFRTTISKKGIGMSWGFPGCRVGTSSHGRKYITIGVPGTGLYFTKYFNSSIKKEEPSIIKQIEQTVLKNKNEIPWWKQKNL
jgi:hypothetical protein